MFSYCQSNYPGNTESCNVLFVELESQFEPSTFCFPYTIPIQALMTLTSTYSIHLQLVPRVLRFRICPRSTRKHGTLGFLGNLGTSYFFAKSTSVFRMIIIYFDNLVQDHSVTAIARGMSNALPILPIVSYTCKRTNAFTSPSLSQLPSGCTEKYRN